MKSWFYDEINQFGDLLIGESKWSAMIMHVVVRSSPGQEKTYQSNYYVSPYTSVKLFRHSYGTRNNPGLPIGQPKGPL